MALDPAHLARFKSDLISLTPAEMFARYVKIDRCMGAAEIDEGALREKIASRFNLDLQDVIIVGSAKLGFTLTHKPASARAEERPVFSPFCESSDVDVAVVSDTLFDNIWKRCFEFWHSSGYSYADGYWPRGRRFRDYIFRGWMRPDHLPSEGGFTYKSEWFDFFRKLTSERAAGDYRISAALYRETYFLEVYQQSAFNKCRTGVTATL